MTPDKPTNAPRLETENAFLTERLSQQRAPRLAVRVVMNLAEAPGNIAQRISDATAALGEQVQAAFKRHLANMADSSQAIATQLAFSEINKTRPSAQAQLIQEGKDASVVAEAAVMQRSLSPEAQAALVEHCKIHETAMRMLAARPDATLDSLAALVDSTDHRTRVNVASNIGSRMRIEETGLEGQKAAIFNALITQYESDYAPYLVPVCRSSEQLREMFDGTSKTLGVVDVFVENPYTPDSVLLEIASSPKMQFMQHDAAKQAKELLMLRAEQRESSNTYDDMGPP